MGQFFAYLIGLPIVCVIALIPLAIAANFVSSVDSVPDGARPIVYAATLVALPLIGIMFALVGLANTVADAAQKQSEAQKQ